MGPINTWIGERSMCGKRDSLFFLVSGEHPTLPQAEIKAILESEAIPYTVINSEYRLFELDSSLKSLEEVGKRSLMMELCGQVVSEIECGMSSTKRIVDTASLQDSLRDGESFAVRSVRLAGARKTIRRTQLERDLGRLILKERPGARVDLESPDKVLLAIVTSRRVLLGLVTNMRERGAISRRRPRKRPHFHPSTMQPKLARCMVNLARPRPGEILLDPFCGVGGHLIEAGLMGCKVVGIDVAPRMVKASFRNLKYFGVEPAGLLVGDGRRLPVSRVDALATDPPYGRGASTAGATPRNLLSDFLNEARDILDPRSFICLAAAKETGAPDIAKEVGFTIVERYEIYVHRSLTRQIVVLSKS
jgi:tRNA (guanine10-N2)-dimethyltransferase